MNTSKEMESSRDLSHALNITMSNPVKLFEVCLLLKR